MSKGLVAYDSATGNTEKMAMAIGRGMERAGLEVKVKRVDNIPLSDLTDADAIVLGSPVYFSTVSNKMKRFIDGSIKLHRGRQLRGKVGAAFASFTDAGELTLLSLISAFLWHGMIVVGHQSGGLGATSVREPDDKCIAECEAFGERIADITKAINKK